jgi:CheY-like chemotaxis protein
VVGLSMPTEGGPIASFAISNLLSKPIRGDEVLVAMAKLGLPEKLGKVMVVDDDPLAQDLMRVTLGAIGIKTVACMNGEEALRAVRQEPPDALILDLMMPGMNGFEVLHALRGMPEGRDLPVFIWTSMLLTADEYGLLARSARAILTKGGGVPATMVADLQRWHPTGLAGRAH